MLELDVFTLFPDHLAWMPGSRPIRNAISGGALRLRVLDLREHAPGRHRQVDDTPYGGGAGMVIRVDVVCAALEMTYAAPIERILAERRLAVLTPVGRQLTDAVATELAGLERLTLLCGRYEGFDQRVHDHLANDAVSIGPYVLSGGEVAAMAVIDAVTRKLPGALGHDASHLEESFSPALEGRPEYPHYTRPEEFRGWTVPPVLLSGDHAEVARWRERQSQDRAGSRL
ncbi:MAG TPA: tRNA (guanosine(37)-N1)-methyltransferase TrmD [Gaiellales bacterium]|jgi:tRNA (guanine37-N1)-methyltransferase|nr:tRNA (guanosine(37)-N1)-methyltransferase TrmD [Gaiellales bacterium]